jgi:mediator of RNA polymerase II transcription subunit 13
VYCDPFRDGIWVFNNRSNTPTNSTLNELSTTDYGLVEVQGTGLLLRDKGSYEPASLARIKAVTANNLGTPSSSSSPSSSLESTVRNTQVLNSRAVQANGAQNVLQEPPTPSPGIKSGIAPSDASISSKEIHERFISSVLGSIVYFLCRDHGFIPLNSRTLISTTPKLENLSVFSNDEMAFDSITLATLDISLTSLGTLVIKAHSDIAPGLQSIMNTSGPERFLDSLSPRTALLLAPVGNAAKLYGTPDEGNLPGSLPISQLQANPVDHRQRSFNGVTIKSWQSKCLELFTAKGLNAAALESGGWVFVQLLSGDSPYFNADYQGSPMLEDLAIVPWPKLLCFQTSSNGVHDVQPSTSSISSDPLSFAEDWYTSKDERANSVNKRQKERQVAEALSREQAEVEARNLQSNTYSPAALRRGSNAGAMYPTPPDAVHNPIGATPTFDGTASTPGNPNTFVNPEVGMAVQANPGLPDTEAELWASSVGKDRTDSNVHPNDNDNDNDNLFGDAGGNIFISAITDDDFSFFDDPDAVPTDQKPSSPPDVASSNDLGGSDPMDISNFNGTSEDVVESQVSHMQDQSHNEAIEPSKGAVRSSGRGPSDGKTDYEMVETIDTQANSTQPPISPLFDKEAVFRKLFPQSPEGKHHPESRRASVFNNIDFENSLPSFNEKYGVHGRFSFPAEGKPPKNLKNPGLPQTEYLSNRLRFQDNESEPRRLARMLMEGSAPTKALLEDCDPMDYLMNSDGASQLSEQDDTSYSTDEPKSGVKRKWLMEDEGGDDMASSFDALAVEFEQPVATPQSISGSQIPLLDVDPADWSLTTYFTSVEPDVQSNALTDLERIATAQILADQAVSGTLQLPGIHSSEGHLYSDNASPTRELIRSLSKAANVCLTDVAACTLRSFLEIQGIPILNQNLRLPPRPMPNPRGPHTLDATRLNNPFSIPPPRLEVRRSDTKLTISSAAIAFWENLGLGPSNGGKDVHAVCVYPNTDGVAGYASIFLDQIRSVYESARLGGHDRVTSKDLTNGLLPFAVDSILQNKSQYFATLKDTTARLSRMLSSLDVEEKNLVVYFVYPVDNGALLVHICSAFQHLFNLYRRALSEKKIHTANELVLQLIPLDFIISSTSLSVPSPSEYARLAMEVYDRCIDFTSSSTTPAIMLEQPLPKSIDFKLNANSSAFLLQENSCLHIAYAQSIDDRWITAAWTDNRGNQQMTASYCLGRKNEPISMPFSDVANEIWETTLDFISSKKIQWRIMISRIGVMDPSEIEIWAALASTESDTQINLTLMTVQTHPSLRLLPPSITISPKTNTQSAVTPVSTPQPSQSSIVSPDNASTPARETAANAATPVENPTELDSDARLIDYTDQSWGAVLSHRLNNSNSLLELNPALISGYLIKRGGTNSDDPPIVMEVNIVHCEVVGNPRTFHEGLLREILGYYRGLGILARVRGVVDPVKDVRPWHIAAAEKAVKALYVLM